MGSDLPGFTQNWSDLCGSGRKGSDLGSSAEIGSDLSKRAEKRECSTLTASASPEVKFLGFFLDVYFSRLEAVDIIFG